MNEQDILTFLIVFALFINCLGFLFFGLSLRGKSSNEYEERYKEPKIKETKIKKDKKMKKEKNLPEPEEAVYEFKTLRRDFEKEEEQEDEEDLPYRFNTMDGQDRFTNYRTHGEKENTNESLRMFDDDDDGIPLKRIDEDDPQQFNYEPVYEEEPKEHTETIHVDEYEPSEYQFTYEPKYEEPAVPMEDEPLTITNDSEEKYREPVDYADEVKPGDNQEDLTHRYDGEYQFKHAYTKAERYKYEYGDYKTLGEEIPTNDDSKNGTIDDFPDDYDVDKEHEKFYGSDDQMSKQRKYDTYLRELEENDESSLMRAEKKDKQRNMYQQTNLLEDVPETPLDLNDDSDEKLDTFDIKQFEPLKYKDKIGVVEDEESFDDEEVDRRIEYLMGKMNDPFKKEKEKDPLEEEF